MSLRRRVSFGALSDTQVTPRTPYVLLRYAPPDGEPCWLEGRRPVGVIEAHTHDSVLPALVQVEQATAQGLTAVGYVAYEAAHGLDTAFPRAHAPLPLVWFAVFEQVHELSGAGAPFCPHPLCPPLPPAGEGEWARHATPLHPSPDVGARHAVPQAGGRTAVRPYTPLPPWGRGAGGEGVAPHPHP
jgi:hypothetical protein